MDWPVVEWPATGPPKGRALLIHGLSSSKEGWWRVGPALADMGYDVVAPDLRGHGSAPSDGGRSFDDYAADLLALAPSWDLVLAHSLGGATALRALAVRPDWTRRLVLEDPALVIPDPDEAKDVLMPDFDRPLTTEVQSELNPTWSEEDCRVKAVALADSGPEAVIRTVDENPGWNVVAEVTALAVPTLLVAADPANGPLVPPELGEPLAEMNDAITYTWIPNSSHSLHRDEFEAFLATVADWLK